MVCMVQGSDPGYDIRLTAAGDFVAEAKRKGLPRLPAVLAGEAALAAAEGQTESEWLRYAERRHAGPRGGKSRVRRAIGVLKRNRLWPWPRL